MRTADHTFSNFRANILDWADTRLLVQCPKADIKAAAMTYRSSFTDAWDPMPTLPFCLRYAWPIWGDSGREAKRIKPSFYFQLVRQFRAASVFAEQIDFDRDWILKWRPDLNLYGPLDWRTLLTRPAALWLPQHDNHGGFNDQCALGPARLMMPYLRRLERLDDYFAEGGRIHAESFLRWALSGQPVRRIPLPYCIHRGGHLNPVKIKASHGDQVDPMLIETLVSAGVTVELDSESAEAVPVSIGRNWIGGLWQNTLSRSFRAASLARAATAKPSV